MNKKLLALLSLFFITTSAYAAGSIIVAAVWGSAFAATAAGIAIAFAINMVVSSVLTKALFSPNQPSLDGAGQSPNPGNRQQVPPATDNKLPVVYGSAWLGGTIVDLSITSNNQDLYYVIALCEVTNSNSGQTPDTINFGDIYYGGKKVTFRANGYTVASLTDESTGIVDTTVDGKIEFYLYRNGSNSNVNSPFSAITVMQNANLVYQWDSNKLMSNCAFAILHLTYNADAGIRGIEQTRFQVINSRSAPGDCIADYLINTRYGAALPASQIDYTSLTALNTYSNQSFSYTTFSGTIATQTRFRFDGTIDTNRTIMQNLQDMASCCDCLLKYNEITAKWGVIVQQPTYTVAININDSNIVSAIQITPIDLNNSFNVIECKFPDKSSQDAFNSATFDLAEIDPALLFPNEPVNKQSVSLPLVNDSVRAQYIANRLLKAAREDLQVDCSVGYIGLQFEAGDIVTVTNANYGWTAKPFRINKVVETFRDDGSIVCQLLLMEFNASIYDDVSITEFQPSPNTGIGDPLFFGTLYAPVVASQFPTAVNPLFNVLVTTASSGITQYAELWYSAFSNPTPEQLIFIGTSEIKPDGAPWGVNTALPSISVATVPAGNWYLFTRMVNSLGTSAYSPASALFQWRPSTFQYNDKYLAVAYGTSLTGAGFSFSPTGKTYYGLCNQSSTTPPTNPSAYTWYLADPNFGTTIFLCYTNRTGRKFSFDTGLAAWVGNNASFVPTNALEFDPSIWSALPDGTNIIDLDIRTGQLLQLGTTSTGLASGEIGVTNNPDGRVVAQLKQFLDFGGAPTFTGSAANITIDIYGRVVGFVAPDNFYYTKQSFTATSGQTVFNVTRASGYITGQCFVFQNGCLLDTSEYTDSASTVTLFVGATSGDIISIISVKAVNASTGPYSAFTRTTVDLTDASSYLATGITSGYELLFINGTILNELDYNIVGEDITDFPSTMTGKLTIIQWTQNNLGQPAGFCTNIVTFTVIGQTLYAFSYDANAFNLYANGVLYLQGSDYTTATGTYTLTETPDNNQTVLVQQTFARTGAV